MGLIDREPIIALRSVRVRLIETDSADADAAPLASLSPITL